MTRPTDWYVLELDGDPTPGDPARVRQLATRFHDFADTAHRAKLAVESLQGDGSLLTWVGMSGDAFRKQFGDFPNQVNKLYQSHLMAGDALEVFAPVLENAQAQADRALADGRVAADKLTSLQGALSTAQTDFTGASGAAQKAQAETQKPDPDQIKQAVRDADAAQQRLTAAQSSVNGAQQEFDLAKQLAEQARQMRDGAARTCVREIEDASDAGIQPRNFWQKLGDALKELWNIICEVAKWVALIAGIIGMILGGPLAWIALAAGAILLIKAIVDFAQGKGSVLDLVMGVLGIIPGVKGLTSLSKLSALYKAGGVKEIAKAALTGMKNMAKDMVGVIKAAGAGAITIVKKLGDTGASALGAVKNAGVIVGDAVKAGGAKLGDLLPGGGYKPIKDLPVTTRGGDTVFGAPAVLPKLPTATPGKSFTTRFQELSTLKMETSIREVDDVTASFAAKLKSDQGVVVAKYDGQIAQKTADIKADFATKMQQGKLDIEARYAKDLEAKKVELTTRAATDLKVTQDGINAKFDKLVADRPGELQTKHMDLQNQTIAGFRNELDTHVGDLQNGLKNLDGQAQQYSQQLGHQIDQLHNAGQDASHLIQTKNAFETNYLNNVRPAHEAQMNADISAARTTFDTAVADLPAQTQKAYEAELAADLKNLGDLRTGELEQAGKSSDAVRDAAIGQADLELQNVAKLDLETLTTKLGGEESTALADATAKLDGLRQGELSDLAKLSDLARDADIAKLDAQIDTHFAALDKQLHGELLDAASQDIKIPNGSVKVVSDFAPNIDALDLNTIAGKNWPKLGDINPNKLPGKDVNCTLCVQSVWTLVRRDYVHVAPKLQAPKMLETIESNFKNTIKFKQYDSYDKVFAELADKPAKTVGVIGMKWVNADGNTQGHVLNLVSLGNKQLAVVDAQVGGIGHLMPLDYKNAQNELWFVELPKTMPK